MEHEAIDMKNTIIPNKYVFVVNAKRVNPTPVKKQAKNILECRSYLLIKDDF